MVCTGDSNCGTTTSESNSYPTYGQRTFLAIEIYRSPVTNPLCSRASRPTLTSRMEGGVKDQIEQFNWQRDMKTQEFPSTMQPFLGEVKTFCDKTHNDVLFKVLRCEWSVSDYSCAVGHRPTKPILPLPLSNHQNDAPVHSTQST
jgi:hypothetical protein